MTRNLIGGLRAWASHYSGYFTDPDGHLWEIMPWLILCLAWHCPARGISAFQDGVHVLFAGGEITQDALR